MYVSPQNALISLLLTGSMTAPLSRGRNLPASLPAMYDSSHDPDKNVLCRFSSDVDYRRLQKTVREGIAISLSLSPFI
jgi:hypothetical protein